MKQTWKYSLIAILALVALGNVFSAYIRVLTEGPGIIYTFETQSAAFQYAIGPEQEPEIARMEREFEKYLRLNPEGSGQRLYRTFRAKPWKFWNWYHYLTSDLYDYPYKDLGPEPRKPSG